MVLPPWVVTRRESTIEQPGAGQADELVASRYDMATIKLSFIAFVLGVLASLGCGGGSDQVAALPADSATLRLHLGVAPTSYDPHRANITPNLGVTYQLFRGLFWYSPDLKLIPMMAKEIPTQQNGGISNNNLLYKIKLREDIKWSNGEALTAADFEYSAKRLLDPSGGASRAAGFFDIQGAEKYNTCKACPADELARLRDEVGVRADGPTTLIITLKNARATLPHIMTDAAFFPVSRTVVEKHGANWTAPENFVGSGPFVLKEVSKDRVVLAKNPHWFGAPAKVGTVVFEIVPDLLQAYNAYLNGDLDVVEIPPDQKATVDKDPRRLAENVKQPLLQTRGYFFNLRMEPFDNPRVREAIALSLDRELFVRSVLQGVGRPAYSWLPPEVAGHSESLGKTLKFNEAKAREALAAAGYPEGKGLPRIVYPYRNNVGLDKLFAEFFQSELKRVLGVQVELDPIDPGPWGQALTQRKHQVWSAPWTFGVDGGSSLSEVFGCQRSENDSCVQFPGNNLSQYYDPDVDLLLQQAAKELSTDRRVSYYAKAEKEIVGDVPAAFMVNVQRNILVNPKVRDLVKTPLDGLFPGQYHLERAYIAKQ